MIENYCSLTSSEAFGATVQNAFLGCLVISFFDNGKIGGKGKGRKSPS